MPKQRYALEKGGPKCLEISFTAGWRDFTIAHNAEHVATITDPDELKRGVTVALADGSSLSVRVVGYKTILHRNGQPLPGSGPGSRPPHAPAYTMVFLMGLLTLGGGLMGVMGRGPALADSPELGWTEVAIGAVFLVLGVLIKTKMSLVALGIAVGLAVLDALVMIGMVAFGPLQASGLFWAYLVVRAFFLLPMSSGFKAIRDMRTHGAASQNPQPPSDNP